MKPMIAKFVNYVQNLGAARKLPERGGWDPAKERMGADPRDAAFEEIFGATDFTGKPSKDHRKWRSEHEKQQWSDCVTFSAHNTNEAKSKANNITDDEGKELNLSDLYTAVGSGTTRNGGNSLKAVAEFLRKEGTVLERVAPYTLDWNKRIEIYNAVPTTAKRYKINNYQTVGVTRNSLKNALEFSEGIQVGMGLGVTYRNSGIITPPKEVTVYHAMKCDYIDAEGCIYCQDHYNRSEVVFSADYPVMVAMAFADLPLDWRGITDDTDKFYSRFINKYVQRTQVEAGGKGEVYLVEPKRIRFVRIDISESGMKDKFYKFQRDTKVTIPVSEKDFQRLAGYIIKVGGEVIDK